MKHTIEFSAMWYFWDAIMWSHRWKLH